MPVGADAVTLSRGLHGPHGRELGWPCRSGYFAGLDGSPLKHELGLGRGPIEVIKI